MSYSVAFFGAGPPDPTCRGVLRELAARGHTVTLHLVRADAGVQTLSGCRTVLHAGTPDSVAPALDHAARADVVLRAGRGDALGAARESFEDWLDAAVLAVRRPEAVALYWDPRPRATLERVESRPGDALGGLLARYDGVLAGGGGPAILRFYRRLGARLCMPLYPAIDPLASHPAPPDLRFAGDLGCAGDGVEPLFGATAARMPERQFVLAGDACDGLPANVTCRPLRGPAERNVFFATPLAILTTGGAYAPPAALFEAAGACACIIALADDGLALFFEPGREVLAADGPEAVQQQLRTLDPAHAGVMGRRALRRVLAEHTLAHRALQLDLLLSGRELRQRLPGASRG